MDDAERTHRDALAAYHRRTARYGTVTVAVVLPLAYSRRAREAWAARDAWTLAAVGMTLGSGVLSRVVAYRRAERRADEDLHRQAQAREAGERAAQGQPATGQPEGRASAFGAFPDAVLGCFVPFGFLLVGSARAVREYARRPDAGRRVSGPRWHPRPGPAWWTAVSWQQLPVNGASRAPRAAQIAYERRQLVTQRSTALAAQVASVGGTQIQPALAGREWLRAVAGVLAIATSAVTAVADHHRVPRTVDRRRERRRRHDAAVAALVVARRAGRPGPAVPWRGDAVRMLLTTAAAGAGLVVQLRLVRHRPQRAAPAAASR